MEIQQYNKSLFSFLQSSPTAFHAVATIEKELEQKQFQRLEEYEVWRLEQGRSYFVSREQGSIIAFTLGTEESIEDGFRMLAAHTDSPSLQIKPQPDLQSQTFHQLGVEVYGGPLLTTWFDRDLSLAGRVCCSDEKENLSVLLLDFKRPLLTIPSLAIHFNREANNSFSVDKQKHLPPLLAQHISRELPKLEKLLLERVKDQYPEKSFSEILSFDLFCYDTQPPTLCGANKEFISGGRLDNLVSCHAGTLAIMNSSKKKNSLLFCANHEENGSTSSVGAQGSFFEGTLERILAKSQAQRASLHNSFLISMDNSHGYHPNYSDTMESKHRINLNHGPVIKINANQRYATNSVSSAIYKTICRQVDLNPQEFVMRSDLPCGSTIGPMTAARLGVRTIDIGIASLGMHSIRELTGSQDPEMLFKSVQAFFKSNIHKKIR